MKHVTSIYGKSYFLELCLQQSKATDGMNLFLIIASKIEVKEGHKCTKKGEKESKYLGHMVPNDLSIEYSKNLNIQRKILFHTKLRLISYFNHALYG